RPAEGVGAATDADVDERRQLSPQLEPLRELLQLERNTQAALDGFLSGHGDPEQHRKADRQQLQTEMAERCDHVYCTSRPRTGVARWMINERRRRRSTSASRPRSISPSTTREMRPVSSDTTIAMESFSSVSPMAARCREPSSLLNRGLTVSGRKQ